MFVDVNFMCPLGLEAYSQTTATVVDHESSLGELSAIPAWDKRLEPDKDAKCLVPFVELLVSLGQSVRDQAAVDFEEGDLDGHLAFQSEETQKRIPPDMDKGTFPLPLDVKAIRKIQEELRSQVSAGTFVHIRS